MLDLKALLVKILDALKVDYVVEEGTNTGWEYRKWNSGKLEAWYKANNLTVYADNAFGNAMYYHTYSNSWTYPSMFLTVTNLQVQAQTGNGFWWIQPHELNPPYIPFYSISNRNTAADITLYGYMVGTWK